MLTNYLCYSGIHTGTVEVGDFSLTVSNNISNNDGDCCLMMVVMMMIAMVIAFDKDITTYINTHFIGFSRFDWLIAS